MHPFIKPLAAAIVLALASGLALDASAADVRAGISTRETYVGLPITFQIQVRNATKFDAPAIPEIDGLKVESLGTPSRSTQTTIINGSMSTNSSVIYSYQITPTRTGSFRIPPIAVAADGQQLETRAFNFVVSKSETGDLLFVEVTGKEQQIFVGQALDLTLKIWVRPYHDKEYNVTLSEADMWHLLSEQTNWGAFSDRIQQLAANNERPVGTEGLRKDRDGVEHNYYLYEIDATIYPKKPGNIDANSVNVVIDYPTALGQSRDPFASFFDDMGLRRGGGMFGDDNFSSPFGARLTVESVRPIVAEAKVEPIEVLEIPITGRPADYRGAVGKYRIASQAKPTNVKAGDSISLYLVVAGTGPMDLVQAPPLAELPSLTADFKVPDEPLAGYVQGAQKVFSTTIRPRKAGITEIPPIPFSYFDPEIGKFVTTQSDPISIHVEPADTLALADVVGRSQATAGDSNNASPDNAAGTGPQLAIYTTSDLLTNEMPPQSLSSSFVALLALPPLAIFALLVLRGRSGFSALALRFASSTQRTQQQIENAETPAEVARALRTLLTKRLRLSAAADPAALIGALRSAGLRTAAVRTERILQQCEDPNTTALSGGPTLAEMKREALEVLDDLQTRRRPSPLKPIKSKSSRLQTSASAVVAAVALAGALLAGSGNAQAATTPSATRIASTEVSLSATQQQTLLAEANERYNVALKNAAGDSAEAKQAFADAAEKYQLLVDSGVHNSRLYFNLANAYLESGATGRAIANYRRSLRLDPTNHDCRKNLAYAEAHVAKPAAANTAKDSTARFEYAGLANGWLSRYVRPSTVLAIAIIAWLGFWIALGARLCDLRFPWKTVAVLSLLLAGAAAASYAQSCRTAERNVAVIVAPDTTLRTGDGESFPSVGSIPLVEGQSVEWLKRRSDWVQIRTEHGQSGWLPDSAVEIL